MSFWDLFRDTNEKIEKVDKDINKLYNTVAKKLKPAEAQFLKVSMELSEAFNALMREHGIGMPGLSYLRGVAKIGTDDNVPFFMMFGFGDRVVETSETYAASERERVKNTIDFKSEKDSSKNTQ